MVVRSEELISWCEELGLTYEVDMFGYINIYTGTPDDPKATFRPLEDNFYVLDRLSIGSSWTLFSIKPEEVRSIIVELQTRMYNINKLIILLERYLLKYR